MNEERWFDDFLYISCYLLKKFRKIKNFLKKQKSYLYTNYL